MLVCAFFCATCTRDRGCSVHPAFPAPSLLRGRQRFAKLGQNMPRERECMFPRHCERSEAIQPSACSDMDCFVASLLAMTAEGCLKIESEHAASRPRSRHRYHINGHAELLVA